MSRGRHSADPTRALFERGTPRPSMLGDRARFDELAETIAAEDLSDRGAALQMIGLRHELYSMARRWRAEDARAKGDWRPKTLEPFEPDERAELIALIDHTAQKPRIPYLSVRPPDGGRPRRQERDEFRQIAAAYNTLLMGVPEIFMGFESGSRTERYARMMGIPASLMSSWQQAARRRTTMPARIRHDVPAAAVWLSRWHPGAGLERRRRIVPESFRAKVRAIGMVSYIVGRERMHVDVVEELMLGVELMPGDRSSTPARLVARDPERWVSRLPEIARQKGERARTSVY